MARLARAQVVHITSSLKMGGAEQVLMTIIEQMPQYDHTVIYVHEGPHLAALRARGIATYQLRGLLFRYDPFFLIRLFLLLRRLQPDLIHTLLWAANIAGRIVGRMLHIPVVSALHNNVDRETYIRKTLDRLTMPYADQVIAVSAGVAQSLAQRDGQVDHEQLLIINNGINPLQFAQEAHQTAVSRAELGLHEEHFIIGSVGRFVPEKNYQLLLGSFAGLYARYAHARLLLVGAGPDEQMLRDLVVQYALEDAVIFVVNKRATPYYPLFDCFALSSDQEGISLALLEAMACGVACVVTHEGTNHPVVVAGSNGLLVPAGSAVGLANALEQLLTDGELRKKLAKNGMATVQEEFCSSLMVARYADCFNRLMVHQQRHV